MKARQNAPRKSSSSKPRLWASEVGGCLRKAMLRISGHQPTIEFSLKALESMQNGVVYEKNTQDGLRGAS